MFGKVKDVDFEILSKLNDRDLGKLCSTDKYFRNLCKNDTFWRNRTITRFGKYLGGIEGLNKYFSDSKLKTWREYYISIIDFLESIYDREYRHTDRPDLLQLNEIIKNNNKILKVEIIKNGKWKEILKLDLIDPNNVFNYYYTLDNAKEVLKYMLSLDDIRIKPWRALNNYLQEEELRELLKILLEDARINSEDVLLSLEIFLRNHYVEDYYKFLDLYLDYIIKTGKVEDLRKIITEDIQDEEEKLVTYIYNYIDDHITSSLPKIFKILNTKKFSKLAYDKILVKIETVE